MNTVQQALDYAVTAIHRGDTTKGRSALSWVLEQDPDNTIALLWMPACLTDENAKQECYRRLSATHK